eukprot:TRINITY_DN38121_c0_g1_i1.p1 TRINITY_DN38121_c0_g1~~TRINITY_DN38121_c0_g1_i1.p1  ORF type:complete len:262 (+),score=58.29 TRINITY_DN38121_c0_g1_i1:120-905(+)
MPDAMASSAERDRSRSPPALRPPSSGPAGADLQAGSLPVARILGQRVIVDDVPSLLDPLKLPRRGARKDARSRLGDLHEEECFGTKMRVHIEPAWLLFTSEEALYLHSERRAIRLVLPVAEDHSSTAASDDEVANAFFRSCSLRDVHFPRRYAAYRHLRREGWTVRPAAVKFGADFSLYAGRVDEVHATYLALVPQKPLLWSDVVAGTRLADVVNKELLVLTFRDSDSAALAGAADLQEFLRSPAAEVSEVVVKRWHTHLG